MGSSRSAYLFPGPRAPPKIAMSAGEARNTSCGPRWGRIGSGTWTSRGVQAAPQRACLLSVAPDAERPEVLEPARTPALGDRHDVIGLPESGRADPMGAAPPPAHRHLVGVTVQKDENAPQLSEGWRPVAARVD